MSYPQNGDFVVTIDSVTSLHPMYSTRVGSSSLIAYCLLLPKFWSRPGGFANAQNKTFLFCARELTYDLNLRTRLRQDQGRLAWEICKKNIQRSVFCKASIDCNSSCLNYLLPEQRDFVTKLRRANKYEPFRTRTQRFRNSCISYSVSNFRC